MIVHPDPTVAVGKALGAILLGCFGGVLVKCWKTFKRWTGAAILVSLRGLGRALRPIIKAIREQEARL